MKKTTKLRKLRGYVDDRGFAEFNDYGWFPYLGARVIKYIHPELQHIDRVLYLIFLGKFLLVWPGIYHGKEQHNDD